MSTSPEAPAKTLTQLVARKIRHAMVDEDVLQSELARRMGKNDQWLSVRLRGRQPIDMNDLLTFARALNVNIHDLLPSREEADEAVDPRTTQGYPHVAKRPLAVTTRPIDNRPNGRPVSDPSRTGYADRSGPRRGQR